MTKVKNIFNGFKNLTLFILRIINRVHIKDYILFLRIINKVHIKDYILFLRMICLRENNPHKYLKIKLRNMNNEVILKQEGAMLNSFFNSFFVCYHRPIKKLCKNPTIVDLGSNLGFTIIDFKFLYPNSKIIGYEMDNENFSLLKKNLMNEKNVFFYNKAISDRKFVEYSTEDDSESYHINSKIKSKSKKVEAISIKRLIQKNKLKKIDYLKLDIEGEEGEVVNMNSDWLKKVRQIQIEYHPQFNKKANFKNLNKILKKFNFLIIKHPTHPHSIYGLNKEI